MEILREEQSANLVQKLKFAQEIVQKLNDARERSWDAQRTVLQDLAGICSGDWCQKRKIRENLPVCAGNLALHWIWKSRREKDMQDIIIALLALYAVWSARKIMRLSAVLHILVRMLGEMLEEEPQDLTNHANRLY